MGALLARRAHGEYRFSGRAGNTMLALKRLADVLVTEKH